MLMAFMVYNDGIQTIQKMAATYGKQLGIADTVLIWPQSSSCSLSAFRFAFLFGSIAGRIGAKACDLHWSRCLRRDKYPGLLYADSSPLHLLAVMVATVQGGTQALSRSLFASLIPATSLENFSGSTASSRSSRASSARCCSG
jgi:UMF1 family MFS transporter